MKSINKSAAIVAGLALSLCAMGAQAAVVANITNISGKWGSVTGNPSDLSGVGTNRIAFGNSTGFGQSAYSFGAASTPINGIAPDGATFGLGSFTHENQPITGRSITGASLTVDITGTLTDETGTRTNFTVTSVFEFKHNETPNECSGRNCSDDIVTAVLNQGASESIEIDGTKYFFSIEGFAYGGNTLSQFFTKERQINTASLVGRFTSTPVTAVPLPAAAWLFGSALLGLAGLGYRRKLTA
jgi:hypothetical protein